jgi:phage tail sheath protein FI
MAGSYKTPGVYIVEKNAFPNSVVEVATAVPAFIGYTEVAQNNGKSLLNKPWRITSMAEFQTYFGQAPVPRFTIEGADHRLTQANGFEGGRYLLYRSMQLFFQNGGGACYIVAVGDFSQDIAQDKLTRGIETLLKEQEPTMLVVPDAVLLAQAECILVQQAMLEHCGYKMKNRFAILDIWGDEVAQFRGAVGTNFLGYGAAYYPWLNTSIVEEKDMDESCITNLDATLTSDQKKSILSSARQQLNLMPPSAAMAGIYTMVDNSRGVWKAPANVSMNAVLSPSVEVTQEAQEDLNVSTCGKSINAIRSFIGEGVLVWGARTLDGNSLDWRYINVRRTMIMLEESIRLATKAYVFEPNEANTWTTIKSTISNFLTGIWKRGGLAGAVADDAFSVHAGLGETMTAEDILEGILRVTVLVAISRPAEFIEITFQQQMQKS